MEKKTKALVIGGLGAALLLGAGGTFALWHDEAQLSAELIHTGNLEFKQTVLTGAWVWENLSNPTADIAKGDAFTSQLVPGDAVKYQWTPTSMNAILDVAGDTLQADLSIRVEGPAAIDNLLITVTLPDSSKKTLTPADFTVPGNPGDAQEPLVIKLGTISAGTTTAELPVIVVGIPYTEENLKDKDLATDLSGISLYVEQTVSGAYYGK